MAPLRVVMDTSNHVKSVLCPAGASGALVDACAAGRCRLVCSPSILAEISDVLYRPRIRRRYPNLTDGTVDSYVLGLSGIADVVPGELLLAGASPDPDDDHVLACAVEGRADYLVTADQAHLLSLRQFRGVRIVTAAEFLAVLRSREKRTG